MCACNANSFYFASLVALLVKAENMPKKVKHRREPGPSVALALLRMERALNFVVFLFSSSQPLERNWLGGGMVVVVLVEWRESILLALLSHNLNQLLHILPSNTRIHVPKHKESLTHKHTVWVGQRLLSFYLSLHHTCLRRSR